MRLSDRETLRVMERLKDLPRLVRNTVQVGLWVPEQISAGRPIWWKWCWLWTGKEVLVIWDAEIDSLAPLEIVKWRVRTPASWADAWAWIEAESILET
jgi:hypothetical protein